LKQQSWLTTLTKPTASSDHNDRAELPQDVMRLLFHHAYKKADTLLLILRAIGVKRQFSFADWKGLIALSLVLIEGP
jgi:hypothetical protein